MFDCTTLKGHFKAVCDGTHRKANGRAHTLAERQEILSRYLRIDAESIVLANAVPAVEAIAKSSVGTRLHEIIERDAGRIECGECRDEISRLNMMSASEAQTQKLKIAEGIVERGKHKAPKFWQRWGATLLPSVAMMQAVAWIDEATGYPWQSQIRHLTFHVWPTTKHDAWQWNLQQLATRWPLFTGNKIIAIATDGSTVPADAVLQFCEQIGISWDHVIVQPNNARIREVATWVPMLKFLNPENAGPNEVVFACHGKGVRHEHREEHIKAWAEVMYQSCLDYWPIVENQLRSKVATGSFRKFGGFKTQCRNFHFSGTFFWWRLAEIGKRDWKKVEQKYWGTENWMSCQAEASETGFLFHDKCVSLYEYKYWEDVIWPAWEIWKQDNAKFAYVP
jgi:hypothetical protein